MTELTQQQPPEYSAAWRQGKEVEERVLRQFLQRVEQEGDAEDKITALYWLFEMYVLHLDSVNSLLVLDEMASGPPPTPYLQYLIAHALHQHLGETDAALKWIQRGYDSISMDHWFTTDYRASLHLKRLELAILAKTDPTSERLPNVLGELRRLMAQSVWDEYFIDALLTLGRLGMIAPENRIIVEMAWADLVRREKFQGSSYANYAKEINDLAMLVKSIPDAPDDTDTDVEDASG